MYHKNGSLDRIEICCHLNKKRNWSLKLINSLQKKIEMSILKIEGLVMYLFGFAG